MVEKGLAFGPPTFELYGAVRRARQLAQTMALTIKDVNPRIPFFHIADENLSARDGETVDSQV